MGCPKFMRRFRYWYWRRGKCYLWGIIRYIEDVGYEKNRHD